MNPVRTRGTIYIKHFVFLAILTNSYSSGRNIAKIAHKRGLQERYGPSRESASASPFQEEEHSGG